MPRQKDILTTGEVAKICNVAPRTVSKWFDSGQLRGYRIPGSKDRRIPLAQIKPGALVDGPVIFDADLSHQVDNMEGLAVHRSGADTVLTMVSDDNFSAIQRTLLLQFTLVE